MADVLPRDILLRVGGRTMWRHGVWAWAGSNRADEFKEIFTRPDASPCATYQARDGLLYTAAAGIIRPDYSPYHGGGLTFPDGSPAFGAPLEESRTNLCLQSENFGTTWVAAGGTTPTRTPAALTVGVLSLDLIGDDSGAANEYYEQTVTFTGDAVKAVSLFLAKGSSPSVQSTIALVDSTAVADRLRAVVTWNGAGVPSVSMSTGSLLRTPQLLASGVYRFEFQTTSVTAANTNKIQVQPATSGVGDTGNIYAGGVMAENAAFPSSYIKTTTVTVTRTADSLTALVNFGAVDQTWLARVARPVYADAAGSIGGFLRVAQMGGGSNPYLALIMSQDATRQVNAFIQDTTTQSNSLQAIPAGAQITIAAQFKNQGTSPASAVDAGSGYSPFGSASPSYTALSARTLTVGAAFGAVNALGSTLIDLIVFRGLISLNDALAVP